LVLWMGTSNHIDKKTHSFNTIHEATWKVFQYFPCKLEVSA
jgi:hypothetical protein